ncbi:MAG: PhoX family phosphatase [Erythrobacter sp.]|uniref:PhoX family protein n=1 Tax=Erythrobacter sp. TaxID=1042 RepID=UPI0025EE91E7|nr:alkaline phosphatase PhoX [Erythrobacter sp.]MCL9999143.1 PhoX family phosphatase [Erythrobacter sp.]
MASTTFDAAYTDGDVDTNFTNLRTLNEIADERFSRRQTLVGGMQASATAFLGTSLLAACSGDEVIGPAEALVNAGQDATTTAGRLVTIAPTVSGSGTATITQVAGPAVTLTGTGNNRSFFAPGVAAATTLTFRVNANNQIDDVNITVNPAQLGFTAVPRNRDDRVTVPAGHNVTVLTRLGDPILAGVPAFANNGTDTNFAGRIGDHGDALYYYGLSAAGMRDDNSSIRGLIVQNHENISEQYLQPNGPTNVGGVRPAAEAIKEIEAHGVSVTEIQDTGNRNWVVINNSALNRRITPNTPMAINGPVRGTAFVQTVASPTGTTCTGTINNCANGFAEWGTNLTCEENWAGYFRRDNSGPGTDNANRTARELTALRRYGVNSSTGNNAWSSVSTTDPIFRRWDARAGTGAATSDYRNEPNTFGWVVEIDPFNPATAPRKRTALGRFAHEGAWLSNLVEGQRIAVYMGDDSRREYMYKFVSDAAWTNADRNRTDRLAVGDKYLDAGTLYVARFNADGTGTWLPLVFGQVPTRPAVGMEPAYTFASQADILVNTRLAADAVGATPMDRPEWTAVNPANGEIYLTLTNNNAGGRPITGTDAANPRSFIAPGGTGSTAGNPNGHIIRIRENGDLPTATTFRWDIYLFGADSVDASANVNLSGLNADNDFSSPDGLWFARPQNPSGVGRPLLWIQTDDGAFTDRTNNQMLAALPGRVGDGGARTITNTNGTTATQATFIGTAATAANLRRFLTGPIGCEITGVDTTPDGRTLFVGIQHPGENGTAAAPDSNWPANQTAAAPGVRPRSAVVAVTRADGGIIGV